MSDAGALVDWAPLLRLLLLGALVAVPPLAWWWWRGRGEAEPGARRRALVLLTLFLTFDLVVFGAFTRLTDSGLGCPDWPGCYGQVSPIGAQASIGAAQEAMPTGPVTFQKAWIEMIHRYFASAVGFLIVVMTVWAWRDQTRSPEQAGRGAPARISPWWPTVTLVWVLMQGAFGALTVTMKLFPAIVTLHLLGGVGLLALLTWQLALHEKRALHTKPWGAALRALAWAAFAVLLMQIALGGWVSTNYAVLACPEFPTCRAGQVVPPLPPEAWSQASELWRELGKTASGTAITQDALVAIHLLHRAWALVVVVVVGAFAAALVRHGLAGDARSGSVARWVRWGWWLEGLLLLQMASGISNVVLGWPMLAALAHTAGAAALVVVLTWLLAHSRAPAQTPTREAGA